MMHAVTMLSFLLATVTPGKEMHMCVSECLLKVPAELSPLITVRAELAAAFFLCAVTHSEEGQIPELKTPGHW